MRIQIREPERKDSQARRNEVKSDWLARVSCFVLRLLISTSLDMTIGLGNRVYIFIKVITKYNFGNEPIKLYFGFDGNDI